MALNVLSELGKPNVQLFKAQNASPDINRHEYPEYVHPYCPSCRVMVDFERNPSTLGSCRGHCVPSSYDEGALVSALLVNELVVVTVTFENTNCYPLQRYCQTCHYYAYPELLACHIFVHPYENILSFDHTFHSHVSLGTLK